MKGSKKIFEFKFEPLDEMISLTQAINLKKLNAGATWVLDNIIAATPVSTALTRVFSSYNRHRKLLSLAYYLYLNANEHGTDPGFLFLQSSPQTVVFSLLLIFKRQRSFTSL